MKKLKVYRLNCAAEEVHGYQTFLVRASSVADAIARHERGESEFEAEELEVQHLGKPEVTEAEDSDLEIPF